MNAESEHIAKFKCRTVTVEELPFWVQETLLMTEEEPNSFFELDCVEDEVNPKGISTSVWVEDLKHGSFPLSELPTWAKEKLSKVLDSTDSDDSNSPEDVEMTGEIERINLTL